MKRFYRWVLMISALPSMQAMAQFDVGLGYQLAMPVSEMQTTVRAVHSLSVSGFYQIPKWPLAFGVDLGAGAHGVLQEDVFYTLENGQEVLGRMTLSNNVLQAGMSTQLRLLQRNALSPYLTLRGGMMHFSTRLSIEDRNQVYEQTENLHSEGLMNDFIWIYGVGMGMHYDLSHLFGAIEQDRFGVDFGVKLLRGATVRHMSVRAEERSGGSDALFIDPDQPLVETPWYVGRVYQTRLEALEYQLRLVYRF